MEFQTKHTHKSQPREKGSGEKHTEKQGYIPAKQRIENLIDAGKRLKEYRNEQYDFPDGKIDENFMDPTRTRNFDMADATALKHDLDIRTKERKASQAALEASREAEKQKAGEDPAKAITPS